MMSFMKAKQTNGLGKCEPQISDQEGNIGRGFSLPGKWDVVSSTPGTSSPLKKKGHPKRSQNSVTLYTHHSANLNCQMFCLTMPLFKTIGKMHLLNFLSGFDHWFLVLPQIQLDHFYTSVSTTQQKKFPKIFSLDQNSILCHNKCGGYYNSRQTLKMVSDLQEMISLFVIQFH